MPAIVGHADNHAGIHTGIGNGEQGIGGHVQPHVLHAAEAASSGQARPRRPTSMATFSLGAHSA